MRKLILFFLACAFGMNFKCAAQPTSIETIKPVLDKILLYLQQCTPYNLVDEQGNTIPANKFDAKTRFAKGDFGINTYEWGVTYSGMLLAGKVFKDQQYIDYVYPRLSALGELYPYVKTFVTKNTDVRTYLTGLQNPRFLDECGAMCAAMCKATMLDSKKSASFRALLENWFEFCMYKEYRLPDGILARHRPAENSVWLDDMYMGITPILFRGKLAEIENDSKAAEYYQEAINQVLLFKKYLWVPEINLFRHGWIEGMSEHPNYHWARANGWAVLTICEVLDIVPSNTKGWNEVMDLFKTFLKSIVAYQAPNGVWHQLINNPETYLETSATAMYVYGIAHAINCGWIDCTAYIDVARSGWHGIARQVNEKGQVENTCVGTGLGWTNTFYANRPVNVYAAHGYGPVILAGAELATLLNLHQH